MTSGRWVRRYRLYKILSQNKVCKCTVSNFSIKTDVVSYRTVWLSLWVFIKRSKTPFPPVRRRLTFHFDPFEFPRSLIRNVDFREWILYISVLIKHLRETSLRIFYKRRVPDLTIPHHNKRLWCHYPSTYCGNSVHKILGSLRIPVSFINILFFCLFLDSQGKEFPLVCRLIPYNDRKTPTTRGGDHLPPSSSCPTQTELG